MATASILDAFTYKWGQDGVAAALTDAQVKAGWAFIGATPPSVEQFNRVHQLQDEKANYLFNQLSAVMAAAGITPNAGVTTTLRDALKGKLIGVRIISTTQVYTPTAGTNAVHVRIVGGGAGGATAGATGASQYSAGPGGGAGGYAESYLTTGFSGVTVTIGAGGAPASAGGTSSFGSLMTCTGGVATGAAGALSNATTVMTGQGVGGSATGGNILNSNGQSGNFGIVGPGGPIGGQGGGTPFGPGPAYVSSTSGGNNAFAFGSGGGGGSSLQGNGSNTSGGSGAAGRCVIFEYA